MLQMMMGGSIYETDKFKQAMDSNYYPLDNMKKSVATLRTPTTSISRRWSSVSISRYWRRRK